MFAKHRTKTGEEMYISQMEDSHLKNTILCVLRVIDQSKALLTQKAGVQNEFKNAMYGYDSHSLVKKSRRMIQRGTEKLYPYIAEACLRGINVTEEMQKTYERSAKDVVLGFELNNIMQIEHQDIDWDD